MKHSPPPWDNSTAIFIPAGDRRVLLAGEPSPRGCRVLSEENYQWAKRCVNICAAIDEAKRPWPIRAANYRRAKELINAKPTGGK